MSCVLHVFGSVLNQHIVVCFVHVVCFPRLWVSTKPTCRRVFCRSIGSVISGVPSLKKLQGASNDDWIDRLNHVWTVFLFALFAIIVSTGQFVGDPIHCWCPAEVRPSWQTLGQRQGVDLFDKGKLIGFWVLTPRQLALGHPRTRCNRRKQKTLQWGVRC